MFARLRNAHRNGLAEMNSLLHYVSLVEDVREKSLFAGVPGAFASGYVSYMNSSKNSPDLDRTSDKEDRIRTIYNGHIPLVAFESAYMFGFLKSLRTPKHV